MVMPRSNDLLFHYTSLFSQDLSKLEPVMAKTSCMNPEDAELIGFCLAIQQRIKNRDAKRALRFENDIIPLLETIAMSKWVKGEITHLGLRLGHRNTRKIDLAADIDAEIEPELNGEQNGS